MTNIDIAAAAEQLQDAQRIGSAIAPLSVSYPGLDLDDAYAIQLANIRRRLDAGATVKGHKVGLTAKAMQEMLGVDEPDYGYILDDMLAEDGASVPIARFLQPKAEVEIAFLLGRPLRGPGVTAADVLAATEAVAPSIEIVDSRIADWKITLADTIADNASSAAVVTGAWRPLEGLTLADVEAELVLNGEVVARGAGRDVLGDPALAVAWLANTLAQRETTLEAGHIVMPGSCTRAVDVQAGDRVDARFAGLGDVSVTFVAAGG